jgi:hypothetical protein
MELCLGVKNERFSTGRSICTPPVDRLDADFILEIGSFYWANKKHNFVNDFGISRSPLRSK